MTQHVRMNGEREFGQFPSPADHFQEPGPGHRPTSFGVENVAALQVLASELAQCPDFLAGERVLGNPSPARRPSAIVNRTVTPRRRRNADLREREYLTPKEVERLQGCRPQAFPVRPPRRDCNSDRLPPWATRQ